MSNDETRHYLNGIFLHTTEANGKSYLTGVATDSHRLSSSSMPLENGMKFKPFILPKKTIFQLCNLLEESGEKIYSVENHAIIFDTNLVHRGVPSTDVDRRVVFNISYFEKLRKDTGIL